MDPWLERETFNHFFYDREEMGIGHEEIECYY